MMKQLDWNALKVRRDQARAVIMYRIVNGLIAIPASLYLTPNTQNTRGHGCKFRVLVGCVDAFNYSFFHTIRIWNQILSAAVVMSPSIHAFKSRLRGIPTTQTSETRRPYNLYCVGGDVKHCTIQSNPDVRDIHTVFISHSSTFLSVCGTWIYRLLPTLHAHLPCTTLLNSEECALFEKKKKKRKSFNRGYDIVRALWSPSHITKIHTKI